MYEFSGKTEQEAIESAGKTLKLDSSQFDIEILESERKLFGKNTVRIRVYPHGAESQNWHDEMDDAEEGEMDELLDWQELQEPKAWEAQIGDFMQELLRRMGQDGQVHLYSRGERLLLRVQDSSDASQLIGKHGKHLEALQILLNAYLGRLHDEKDQIPPSLRVQLDVGGYRKRREARLIKIAKEMASQVERRKNSHLLTAMNPFERRIVHKALNDWPNISTVSEGEGMYKQVRIIYHGN